MKIILSHDVDHLYWSDHLLDTYIIGVTYRSIKESLLGSISKEVLFARLNLTKPLNQLDKMTDVLIKNEIPSTFFFAMNQGLNLSYHPKNAIPFITKIKQQGFEVGLHGINFHDLEKMREEKLSLQRILSHQISGIRNHYLRSNHETFELMNLVGYKFDSTKLGCLKPYKIEDMWEIPITLMDITLQRSVGSYQLKELQKGTMSIIEQSLKKQLPYFVVNFHDVYYSNAYPYFKDWFDWLLVEFRDRGFEYISFIGAIKELEAEALK